MLGGIQEEEINYNSEINDNLLNNKKVITSP